MSTAHSVSPESTRDPLVTIAIPTFNRASWLGDCVLAALSQTYQRFEVLVSDNASTDETEEVLRQFRDPSLRVVRQKSNIGALPNWNACLAEARGEYIVFVSDDDRIAPWMLERCMVLVKREPQIPIILTLSDHHVIEDGRTWQATRNSKFGTGIWEGTDVLLECLKGKIRAHMCSIMMRTDELRAIGGFSIDLPDFGADTAAWVSLVLKGRAGFVNESCATCSDHNATLSSSLTMEKRLSHVQTIRNLIATMANCTIEELRKRREVELEAKRFFAREFIYTLCRFRRKGGKMSEVRRLIWRWRLDLRHIGIVEVFRLPRPIAVVFFPQLTAWIRYRIPTRGVSGSLAAVTTCRLRQVISVAVRRLARRAGISRHQDTVPMLKSAPHSAGTPPTAWFICPDFERPSGGIRKLYRSVDTLNDAGLQAAIVHTRPGFRCTWFDHRTRIISSSEAIVGQRDVIVVPEIYGPSICDLPPGVRKIIFNQGAYIMLNSLTAGRPAAAPYIDNPDLTAVLVISEDSAAVVEYVFPHVPVRRVRHGIDPALHHPPAYPKNRRIAYMSRRRAHEAAQVLELLKLRGALDGWEVIDIDRRTEAEVADLLRTSRIFLSFSRLEGFELPPLEALACGCLVVGYHGFGGREFFRSPFAIAIEDGDVVAFARAVEDVIRLINNDPASMAAASTAGVRFVLERYTRDAERKDLLEVFAPLLQA